MKPHRDISPKKIIEFQQWARENYVPGSMINGVWHPIIQRECVQINEDALNSLQFLQEREEFLRTHMQDKSDLL
jgi:hypothetical protein